MVDTGTLRKEDSKTLKIAYPLSRVRLYEPRSPCTGRVRRSKPGFSLGTESSNPFPRRGEPANHRSRSRRSRGYQIRFRGGRVRLRKENHVVRQSADCGATTRAQNAAVQVSSLRPTLPQHACRRSQHLQPSTPSRFALDAPDLPSRGGGSMEKCGCRSVIAYSARRFSLDRS